jgi:hypothetical protein
VLFFTTRRLAAVMSASWDSLEVKAYAVAAVILRYIVLIMLHGELVSARAYQFFASLSPYLVKHCSSNRLL